MSRARGRALAAALAAVVATPADAVAAARTVHVALDPGQHRALVASALPSRQASLAHGYAALIGTHSGVRFDAHEVPSHQAALRAVCDRRADLMLMLGPLEEAPCALASSVAYYRGETLLASRHANRARLSLTDTRPHRIAVVRGSRYPSWLRRHYPHLQVVPAPDLPGALAAVEAGIADAALGLDVLIRPLVRRDFADSLQLQSAPADLPADVFLVARAADQALLHDIDTAMRAITPRQHAQVLTEVAAHRPFDPPSPAALMRHFRWELAAACAALAALLVLGAWLARAHRAAQRSEQRQARFIGVMSHEVRNAAQALVASVDLLGQSHLDQGQRQLVDAARAAGVGLRQLLGHALDYSRMAAGHFQPVLDWHDVADLAQECIAALHPAAHAKGLVLCLHAPPAPLPRLRTDAAALRQILNNLLGNALKFTASGRIDVTVSLHPQAHGEQLCLTVSDTGIGIPLERQAGVFKPFAQAHDTQSQVLGGAGLGLSICHDLVQALHGRIHLCSASGCGSRFEVTLPVVSEPATTPPAPRPLAGYAVLLVEDHALNRAFVARRLEALGAAVHACRDAAGALQRQAAAPARLVLIDCSLPQVSGYELAQALRRLEAAQAQPPALLVALSAATSPTHVQRCHASGMDAVLCKPLDERQLLAALGLDHPDTAIAAPAMARSDPLFPPLLQSLADELSAMQRACAHRQAGLIRHHAHRMTGALRMLGQEDLADTAADLQELGLASAASWAEADRLLAYLQDAVPQIEAGTT